MKAYKKIHALLLTATLGFNSILGNPMLTTKASTNFSITKKVTIGAGESYKLNTTGSTEGITFKSSNKKIVSVNKKGKITGRKKGTATIIAKVKKLKKTCKVTVKPAAKGIKIKNGDLTLYTESTEQLFVSFTSGYSKIITYKSSNPSVASVSMKGLVMAKSEGTTTITATTFNGKKAKITCTVLDDEKSTSQPTVIPSATPTMTATTPAITATVSADASTVSPTATTLVETPTGTPMATVPAEIPTVSPMATVPAETPTVSPMATVPAEIPTVSPMATNPLE
ncbi:MAG: Ig-like domain-containing protein, partial [Lachnospiraceae bacterium]|nr:Ig-like domain-containing protein [Lachnospiraceae bacterium]